MARGRSATVTSTNTEAVALAGGKSCCVTVLFILVSLHLSPSEITISVSNTMFSLLKDGLEFALIAPVAVVGGGAINSSAVMSRLSVTTTVVAAAVLSKDRGFTSASRDKMPAQTQNNTTVLPWRRLVCLASFSGTRLVDLCLRGL